jgi:hypothetical protein
MMAHCTSLLWVKEGYLVHAVLLLLLNWMVVDLDELISGLGFFVLYCYC